MASDPSQILFTKETADEIKRKIEELLKGKKFILIQSSSRYGWNRHVIQSGKELFGGHDKSVEISAHNDATYLVLSFLPIKKEPHSLTIITQEVAEQPVMFDFQNDHLVIHHYFTLFEKKYGDEICTILVLQGE